MYRPKEAADYLGVVDSTLRRYVMEGKEPADREEE